MEAFGAGIRDVFAGVDSEEAEAASMNLAEIFVLAGNYMTDNKWNTR